ncbi:DUF6328 family protein [Streptomyces sp. HUAS MG91]|uniref:DUF6328 family protein n=1 Tax=Streptomyces tabacisoli TaxID=3156398 RepID=A0AAU8IZX3_9ACTN
MSTDEIARPETTRHSAREEAHERANRRWAEVLQETRVAQTGVQILFGFLLSVAFTSRFDGLGAFDTNVYVATVILGAAATGALIAPVALHRLLTGERMKDDLVTVAGRLMVTGLVLLSLTISGTVLLILHVVLPDLLAEIFAGAILVWFALCWYGLPLYLKKRSARRERRTPQ